MLTDLRLAVANAANCYVMQEVVIVAGWVMRNQVRKKITKNTNKNANKHKESPGP